MKQTQVAAAYVPNPENKPYINHKDGDKLNNNASNLEWVDAKENAIHARDVLGIKRKILNNIRENGFYSKKPILKYDINNNLICEYRSITSAARENNVIKRAIEGKGTIGKLYIWKYKTI